MAATSSMTRKKKKKKKHRGRKVTRKIQPGDRQSNILSLCEVSGYGTWTFLPDTRNPPSADLALPML
jgi:hypothetical protein